MSADLEFFFDPVCPWAWITSRWVENVRSQRRYEVRWRFISLWMINEDNHHDWYTPEYRAGHLRGHQGLRVADRIRVDDPDPTAVGRWYSALGTALHVDQRRGDAAEDNVAFLGAVLADAGFDPSFAAAAEDDQHDGYIRADTELALDRTGRDVGTPIITFAPDTEGAASFFGPVIAKAPTGASALELWDAIETLARSGVAELKRSNRDAPVFD
jgi:2-hydroxychromene-2-carboxylate isomerase